MRATLKMEARMEPLADSANVIGEIPGREKPEEVVVLGGHVDSWDVGQGAQDDGSGVMASLAAVLLIKQLGLQPRFASPSGRTRRTDSRAAMGIATGSGKT